jgi:Leucine-rich repeat (LRR) protein
MTAVLLLSGIIRLYLLAGGIVEFMLHFDQNILIIVCEHNVTLDSPSMPRFITDQSFAKVTISDCKLPDKSIGDAFNNLKITFSDNLVLYYFDGPLNLSSKHFKQIQGKEYFAGLEIHWLGDFLLHLEDDVFDHMLKLTTITLYRVSTPTIPAMNQIKEFYLSKGELRGQWKHCEELQQIVLIEVKLDAGSNQSDLYFNCPKLTKFVSRSTTITELKGNLTSLTTLSIENSSSLKLSSNVFNTMINLNSLDLNSNELEELSS